MARVLVRDSFSGALLAKGLSWLGMTFVNYLGYRPIRRFVVAGDLGLGGDLLRVGDWRARVDAGVAAGDVPALVKADESLSAWRIYATIVRHPPFLYPALAGGLGYGVIIAFNTCAPLILQRAFRVERGAIWWVGLANQRGLSGGGIDGQPLCGALGSINDDEQGVALLLTGTAVMLLGSVFAGGLAILLWLPYCVAVLGQSMSYPISLSVANDESR